MEQLIKTLEKLQLAISYLVKHKVNPDKKINPAKSIYNFKEKKSEHYVRLYQNAFEDLKSCFSFLNQLEPSSLSNEALKAKRLLKELEANYKDNDLARINDILKDIALLIPLLPKKGKLWKVDIDMKSVPEDIKAEIKADLKEMEGCFNAECYRSCVILCGRLLEIVLHRKYYELTGNDILEKSPGIGLGKIIAKLEEKDIKLDPGLTQQIHLINNVRIFSVHKKQTAFYPTKTQTNAIILYTMDIIEKMVNKKIS